MIEDTLVKVLGVRNYAAGYIVRKELHQFGEDDDQVVLKSAYTPQGDWIGDSRLAHKLIVKMGIQPEKASPDHSVCSIGFCPKEQKWFGWSHRAIHGFGVGDVVKAGDCAASPGWDAEYLAEHPEADLSLPVGFKAETMDDCRQMALAFAASVS